jgi:hypothetical protein
MKTAYEFFRTAAFFGLPTKQVVEFGTEIEICGRRIVRCSLRLVWKSVQLEVFSSVLCDGRRTR